MEPYEKPVRHQRCPVCRANITQSTDLLEEEARLEPGDYAICDHCGGILLLDSHETLVAISEEEVRRDRRFSPSSIENLFETQRAVRARARLLVTTEEDGRRSVQMVSQPEGRKPYHGKN